MFISYLKSKARSYFLRNIPEYYYTRCGKKLDISKEIPVFSSLAKTIVSEGRTFLQEDRLYTLFQCIQQLPSNAVAMEIGVYKGGASKFMAHLLREKGAGRLYVCDTFAGHTSVDHSVDGHHKVQDGFSDVSLDEVRAYLAGYDNVSMIVGDIVETSSIITDKKIHFIHMDMDVYPPTKFALEYFWPQLPVGGMIVGDDYGTLSCFGMKKAIDDFVAETSDCFHMHLITGQVVLVKLSF